MAKKRKVESKATDPSPSSKKQQQEPEPVPEEQDAAQFEEVEEEEEEEEEVEEEEYEEVEEEEEEEEEDERENVDNQVTADPSTSSGAAATSGSGPSADEDEEPIPSLLDPLSKDQLINLLSEAASKHRDVADRIRNVANEDPAHRKIFVHGLGWDTDAETLTSVFRQYGEIEDCKAVCDKISGKSKGYGFILFKTRTGARKALEQPQKKIGSRMTACQLASIGPVATPSSQPAVSAMVIQPKMEYTQRKIYVSNVGSDLDPQKLYVFFSKYGEIEEGPLGIDKMTGKPKGFCLFVYKTAEGAKKALDEPHKNFEGHILHCQKAIDGPKQGKPQLHHNALSAQFQRNDNAFIGGTAGLPGHLMAPSATGIGFNQGAATAQALNPALGQALTALLSAQGAGLGLTNFLGLGSAAGVTQGVPGAGIGLQAGYGNQANVSPALLGAFGNQGGMQGVFPNQQLNQGGAGRGQPGAGRYGGYGGGAPYTGL